MRQLAAQCGESGKFLHWGATTQDIMDSAVVLQVRDALAQIEMDIAQLQSILAKQARRYRDTPMAGRTHLQQALPITLFAIRPLVCRARREDLARGLA